MRPVAKETNIQTMCLKYKYKLANTNTDAGAEYDADEGGRVLDCGLIPIIGLPLPGKLKQIRVNQINRMQMQTYLFSNTNAVVLYYNLVPINVSLLPGKLPQIKPNLSYVISMTNTQIQTGKYQKTNTNGLTGTSS